MPPAVPDVAVSDTNRVGNVITAAAADRPLLICDHAAQLLGIVHPCQLGIALTAALPSLPAPDARRLPTQHILDGVFGYHHGLLER